MKRLAAIALALSIILSAATLPARAQLALDQFVLQPPPPAPPAMVAAPLDPAALAGASLDQTVLRCNAALSDPTVSVASATSPWQEFRAQRHFVSDQFFSAPQSLYFEEREDGDDVPSSGPDSDSAGQEITIPPELTEVAGTLQYRYEPGSTVDGDLLRIELYEAGRLNGAGLIAVLDLDVSTVDDGDWRRLDWDVVDPNALVRLRELGKAWLMVTTVNSATAGPTQRVWVDDFSASVCVPSPSLSGVVREGGAPAPDALVLLTRSDAAGARVVASTRTGPDGSYSFGGVPALPAGASYRIWFRNLADSLSHDASRLGFWAGPVISSLADGVVVDELNFDVANVPLVTPPSYATAVATNAAPARLSWSSRGVAGDRYRLCLYDPQLADGATGQPAQLCGPLRDPASDPLHFDLAPSSFAAAPGFGFGRDYRWYVIVYAGDPQADPNVQYGYSFFEHAITLAPTASAPVPGPTVQPGDPEADTGGADWTLLVYVAADNAIGDPARAPRAARPATQLARLAALAAAHPSINIVSLVDEFGPGGARLCAYPAGAAPDCRLRAEPNSADPAALGSLITVGRSRYPASRTALLIIAPGQASGELALDETTNGAPTLTLQGLQSAFVTAGFGGAAKLDLLIAQASNFGTLESLRALAPYVRYLVAPSDQTWQVGALERLAPVLATTDGSDAAAAARGAVAAYRATTDDYGSGLALSIAAYDLGRVAALAQRVDALAVALGEALTMEAATSRPAVGAARAATLVYDTSGNGLQDRLATGASSVSAEEDALLDLRDLALRLRDSVELASPARDRAGEVASLLADPALSPVIASVQRSGRSLAKHTLNLNGASGVAVFFPGGDRLGGQAALADSYLFGPAGLPRDTPWAAMLRLYLADIIGQGPGGVTAGGAGESRFRPLPGGFIRTDLQLPLVAR
jgi:hypothetical protein